MSHPAQGTGFTWRSLILYMALAGVFFRPFCSGAAPGSPLDECFAGPSVIKTGSYLDWIILSPESTDQNTGQASKCPNDSLLYGLFFLALVLCLDAAVLTAARRRRKGLIKLKYPPSQADFDPALVRFFQGRRYDGKTLAACLVNLAVKGYLIIRYKHGHFSLHQKPGGQSPLSRLEKKAIFLFFSVDKSLTLEKTNFDIISETLASFHLALLTEAGKSMIKENISYLAPGLIFSMAGAAAMAAASGNVLKVFAITVWILIWPAGAIVAGFLLVKSLKIFLTGSGLAPTVLGYFLLTFLYSIVALFGLIYYCLVVSWTAGFILFCLIFSSVFFYFVLNKAGFGDRLIRKRIGAMGDYLEDLIKDRDLKEKNYDLFEKYLAYALSLDLEKQWCESFLPWRFQNGDSEEAYAPFWYWGDSRGDLKANDFAYILGCCLGQAVFLASFPPVD